MINKTGDLFTTENNALLHGVNTHGVMGSGIAVPFKNKYPEMYPIYQRFCKNGDLTPGEVMTYFSREGEVIYNAATQDAPGPNARYGWVDLSLREAADRQKGYARVAPDSFKPLISMPRVGCGIGGLKWEVVEQIILKIEEDTGVEFEVWTL